MARIPYPDTEAAREALARSPVPLNVFRMIGHAPAVARSTIDLGVALLSETALDARVREAVILSTAARTGCEYELAQHGPIAEQSGMTAEQIAAVTRGAVHIDGLTQVEAAALAAVPELMSVHRINEKTLSSLRHSFSDRQTVELIMTVGYYVMLANVLNSFAVEVDQSSSEIAAAISENRNSHNRP